MLSPDGRRERRAVRLVAALALLAGCATETPERTGDTVPSVTDVPAGDAGRGIVGTPRDPDVVRGEDGGVIVLDGPPPVRNPIVGDDAGTGRGPARDPGRPLDLDDDRDIEDDDDLF
ncbi:MAG: hypothetical protein ACFBWO_07915 [Paracoccaceae bacterium]